MPESAQIVAYKSALYCYVGIFLTQCVADDVSLTLGVIMLRKEMNKRISVGFQHNMIRFT